MERSIVEKRCCTLPSILQRLIRADGAMPAAMLIADPRGVLLADRIEFENDPWPDCS